MEAGSADSALERRARLAVIWQDLVTPVRAIVGDPESTPFTDDENDRLIDENANFV